MSTADTSTPIVRKALADYFGISDYEERDIYSTFDWPEDPSSKQYYGLYLRHPFAQPVIDRPVFTSWRDDPKITIPDTDTESDFSKAVEKADRNLDLWSYAERIDRLAGIGRFGVVVYVTSDIRDSDDLAKEIPSSLPGDGLDKVNQIKVFSEASVSNIEWGGIEQASEGRWGKPISYDIEFGGDRNDSEEYEVHHSRAVPVPADRLLDDDFFAPPRLSSVINVLLDMQKVMGSIAELAYRGADKGLAINFDPDKVDTSSQGMEDVNEELQSWLHDLQPVMRLVGADSIETLGGEVGDMGGIFEPQLSALASSTQIPKRVFQGDPAGALASAEEDTQAYYGMIQERRNSYVEPHIIRPNLHWFGRNNIFTVPDQFAINWDPLRVMTDMEKAKVGEKVAKTAPQAIFVKEIRNLFGLEPTPENISEDVLNSFLSEMAPPKGAGQAIEQALQETAEMNARNESRVQRGRSD